MNARRDVPDIDAAVVPKVEEAERGLLAAVFLKPDLFDEVGHMVEPDDFCFMAHGDVWRAMRRLHEERKPCDAVTVLDLVRDKPSMPDAPYAWLVQIVQDGGYQVFHAAYYAGIIRNRAIKARLADCGRAIVQAACDPELDHEDCMALAEKRLTGVRDAKGDERLVAIDDAFEAAMGDLRERSAGKPPGMPFGFWPLDRIASLRPGQLWVVAARPKMGKSAFALNIACQISSTYPVLFISLEMTRQELVERIICNYASINSEAIADARLSNEQWQRAEDIRQQVDSWNLYIDDNPSQKVQHIASKARRLKRRYHGHGLVVVDYLQLVEPDNTRDNRNEQVAKITRSLKTLAMELEWPVMMLSQLNRSADGERPRLRHLRDSGAIEQDANSVLFIHRDGDGKPVPSDAAHPPEAEIIIAAQRGGPTGSCKLIWRGEHFRFEPREEYQEFDKDPDYFKQ